MDLVYYLNRHSQLSTRLRSILQPLTYPLFGTLVKLAVFRHHLNLVNLNNFQNAYLNRPPTTPLITVANHHSCLDDFLLFGSLLSPRQLANGIPVWRNVRDATTKKLLFRGGGVDQPSMDFVTNLVNQGEWIHVFPQGRVIYSAERELESSIRIRWGIGRLIAESKVAPMILPIWHLGFDQLNPPDKSTTRTTISRILGKPKCLTVFVGQPVDFGEIRTRITNDLSKEEQVCSPKFRSLLHQRLTDAVQQTMLDVKLMADHSHQSLLTKI